MKPLSADRNPAKTLALGEAVCRELRNFLIYRQHPEILNERARHQPQASAIQKIPADVREIGELLSAAKCERNRKLFFDCTQTENHRTVLIHNLNAQFWVYYFRCGIGLVSLSFFSHLATAESTVLPTGTRTVADSYDFQWFAHDLPVKYFAKSKDGAKRGIRNLGRYFIERANDRLVNPYSIYYKNCLFKEQNKFVRGSLENLKKIILRAYFVCEAIRRERNPVEKIWFSPHATVNCGNLRYSPAFEHSTETLMNQVGALAVLENAPYTVLNEGYGRRVGGESYDWTRKNRHRLFFNFQDETKTAPPRIKIAARFQLVAWLKSQGAEGERIIKTWKLERSIAIFS